MSNTAEQPPTSGAQGAGHEPTESELAAQVVLGLHRLAKQSTLYDSDNEAAVRQLEMTQQAVAAYGRQVGVNPKMFFTEKSVFVGGRLLRAGRTVYASALELGHMMRPFGIDEIAVGFDVPLDDLRKFQQAVRDALRKVGPSPAKQKYSRIRLRRGLAPGKRPGEKDDLPPEQRIVRVYATATVVMRRFLERVAAGHHQLPVGVRRVAQQLADFGSIDSPTYLGKLAVHNVRDEDASRAVNSALVAIGMARQLVNDKRMLARLAMGAMLFDVGTARVAGLGPTGEGRIGAALPRLAEHQIGGLPTGTAAVTWAAGGFGEVAQIHTVLTYESLALAHRAQCEPPYGGLRTPTTLGRIIATARQFVEMLADPSTERTVDQSLCALLQRAADQADRTSIRLLLGAIGALPTGALVQLATGITVQVVETRDDPLLFARPTVRAVMDATGGSISGGALIDLAADGAPLVARLVDLGHGGQQAAPQATSTSTAAPPAVALPQRTPTPYPEDALDVSLPGANPPVAPPAPEPPAPPPQPLERTLSAAVGDVPTTRPANGQPAVAGMPAPAPPVGAFAEGDDDGLPAMLQQALVDGRNLEEGEERTRVFAGRESNQLAALLSTKQAEERSADELGDKTGIFTDGRRRQLAALLFPQDDEQAAHGQGAATNRDANRQTRPRPAVEGGDRHATTPRPQRPRGIRAALAGTPPDSAAPASPRTPLAMAPARRGDRAAPAATPDPMPSAALEQAADSAGPWLRQALSGKTPTASGALSKTPLVHLLVYSLDQKLTGTTMLLAPTGARHFIYFYAGVIAKVRAAPGVAPLDRVLLDLRLLDATTLHQSLLAISKSGELHGRHLVEHGLLDEATLLSALTWQLVHKVAHMLQLPPTTRYAFYQGSNLLETYGGAELTPAEPLMLIMAGVRLLARQPLVEQTLSKLGDVPLRLKHETDMTRLALHDDERGVVDLLRARPHTMTELLARNVAQPWVVRLTAYALLITRCLNLGGKGRPPVGYGTARVPMPSFPRRDATSSERHPAARMSPGTPQPGLPGADNTRPGAAAVTPAPRPAPVAATATPPAQGAPSAVALGAAGQAAVLGPGSLPHRGSATGRRLPRRGTSTGRGSPAGRSSAPGEQTPQAPAPPPPPRRASPPSRSASSDGANATNSGAAGREGPTREQIAERVSSIDDQTYYQILGVAQDADADAVQSAYLQFVKRWHPDRTAADVQDMKAEGAKIFARANEAYQALSNPERRAAYDQVVASGGGTAHDREIVERVVDSALAFQKAEVLFKQNHYAEAEALVRQAVDADPEQPEYRTLLAWIEAVQKGPPPAGAAPGRAAYSQQLATLDEVIKSEPKYERALFYRAQLLKRCGLTGPAMRDFRLVTEINPRNIDAAREVRLHDKRKQAPGGGGLFGKLFGGKNHK